MYVHCISCQVHVNSADAGFNIEQAVLDKTCENTNGYSYLIPQGGNVDIKRINDFTSN